MRMKSELRDSFGRVHTSMRVSVTDRCNLRCAYCMPQEGMKFLPRKEVLSYADLAYVVQLAAQMGVRNIRISGGEPLVRQDVAEFVEMVRPAVDTVALTTNGLLLKKYAQDLKDAGLDRLNVSLDSLVPSRFERITRFGLLEQVWEGIEEATRVGLGPIKINTLMLSNFNEDEVDRWVSIVKESDVTVRFMELMPIGENALEDVGGFYDLTLLRKELQGSLGIEPARHAQRGNGPATYWQAPGWKGQFGFITPMSESYCGTCSRLRLTCTGQLRACLAYDEHVNLKEAVLRRDDDAVRSGFHWAVATKRAGHPWQEGVRTVTGMSEMGG